MSFARRVPSMPVRRFGRRQPFVTAQPFVPAMSDQPARGGLSDDLKLFAITYVAGLLFMTAYLA